MRNAIFSLKINEYQPYLYSDYLRNLVKEDTEGAFALEEIDFEKLKFKIDPPTEKTMKNAPLGDQALDAFLDYPLWLVSNKIYNALKSIFDEYGYIRELPNEYIPKKFRKEEVYRFFYPKKTIDIEDYFGIERVKRYSHYYKKDWVLPFYHIKKEPPLIFKAQSENNLSPSIYIRDKVVRKIVDADFDIPEFLLEFDNLDDIQYHLELVLQNHPDQQYYLAQKEAETVMTMIRMYGSFLDINIQKRNGG